MEETFGHNVRAARGGEPRSDDAIVASAQAWSLVDRTFGREDITLARHGVSECLVRIGLAGERLQSYVLAINEVITNVVLHGGGFGRLVLRLDGTSVWCEVTDSGRGIPAEFLSDRRQPGAFQVGGRGLWLAHRLCDEVTVATGPIGTSIGLRMSLPHTGPPG